jgi:hypothetical protein
VLFNRGRRGLALKDFDIRRDRDRFNVFEVLITGSFTPGKKLLDCPVIGCSCVSVADDWKPDAVNWRLNRRVSNV